MPRRCGALSLSGTGEVPVQRFRRVEDAPPPAPLPPGPERARRLRSLWGGWSRVLPPLDLGGVRLYRDLEEAARDREAAVARRCRRLLAERGRGNRTAPPPGENDRPPGRSPPRGEAVRSGSGGHRTVRTE